MLIDFKEIPESNAHPKDQDLFEKFCRDFFKVLGFEILSEPARGADGGMDIKVLEVNSNGLKMTWLVSCKHYAHSGKSITKKIESDIRDRLERFNCDGFIGFYSTTPNQSLANDLMARVDKIPYRFFDSERIETEIIGIRKFENLFLRYFPKSYLKWKSLYYFNEPVKLLDQYIDTMESIYSSVLPSVFSSTGHLIKILRRYQTFEDALEKENISYFVVGEFNTYPFNGMNTSFEEMTNSLIPTAVLKSCNVQLQQEFVKIHVDGHGLVCAVYPNYLFVSPLLDKHIRDLYSTLRSMIE